MGSVADCACAGCRRADAAMGLPGPPDGSPSIPDAEVDEVVADIRRSSEARADFVRRIRGYVPRGRLWGRMTPSQRWRVAEEMAWAHEAVDAAFEGG